MPTHLRGPGSGAPRQTADRASAPEIDGFGAWISFLVVFASVLAVIVVWHNLNDHAYTLTVGAPHVETVGGAIVQK